MHDSPILADRAEFGARLAVPAVVRVSETGSDTTGRAPAREGAALSRAGRTQCAPTPGVLLSEALRPLLRSVRSQHQRIGDHL